MPKIYDQVDYVSELNFLKSAHFVAFTATAPNNLAENGLVPHGAIYPANDETAEGIVFHATEAGQPMSLIVEGHIYENRLHEEPSEEAKEALKNIGFYTE